MDGGAPDRRREPDVRPDSEDLTDADAEFLVRLTAYDETTGQTVHVRSSYKADEVKWGVKFVNIIDRENADGIIRVDVTRLDEIEPAALPTRTFLAEVHATECR